MIKKHTSFLAVAAIYATALSSFASNTIGIGAHDIFGAGSMPTALNLNIKAPDHSWRLSAETIFHHARNPSNESSKDIVYTHVCDNTQKSFPECATPDNWQAENATFKRENEGQFNDRAWLLTLQAHKYFPLVDNILWSVGVSGTLTRDRFDFNETSNSNADTDNAQAFDVYKKGNADSDPTALSVVDKATTRTRIDKVSLSLGLAYPVSPSWWLYADSSLLTYRSDDNRSNANRFNIHDEAGDHISNTTSSTAGNSWHFGGAVKFGTAVYFR